MTSSSAGFFAAGLALGFGGEERRGVRDRGGRRGRLSLRRFRGRLVLALPPRGGQLAPVPTRLRRGGLVGNAGDPAGTRVAARQQGDRLRRLRGSVAVRRLRQRRTLLGRRRGGRARRDRAGQFGARRRHRPAPPLWSRGRGSVRAVEHRRRQVDLRGRPGARFIRRRTAQPDPDAVPGGDPADHEKTHVAGVVGVDVAAVLQPLVGDALIGVVHAQAGVGDP